MGHGTQSRRFGNRLYPIFGLKGASVKRGGWAGAGFVFLMSMLPVNGHANGTIPSNEFACIDGAYSAVEAITCIKKLISRCKLLGDGTDIEAGECEANAYKNVKKIVNDDSEILTNRSTEWADYVSGTKDVLNNFQNKICAWPEITYKGGTLAGSILSLCQLELLIHVSFQIHDAVTARSEQ